MKTEEIEMLAREYAESVNPDAPYDNLSDGRKKIREACISQVYIPLMQWLQQTHCIVPKSKVIELYRADTRKLLERKSNDPTAVECMRTSRISLLERLFGSELFNTGKE